MITATTNDGINITDPLHPVVVSAVVTFDPDEPLGVRFQFANPDGSTVDWAVGRQLVVDGLGAVMLTGMGDFKCRSTATRFIIHLSGEEGWAVVSLPRDTVEFVTTEAESVSPIADADWAVDDASIEAWLGESA